MINETTKKRLREIAEKLTSEVTQDDKDFVLETAAELGIQISVRGNCKMCYVDGAILCYKKIVENEAAENAVTDTRKYILKPNTDVWFGSIRVNEATLTDEMAEKIIAKGLQKKYFIKCE